VKEISMSRKQVAPGVYPQNLVERMKIHFLTCYYRKNPDEEWLECELTTLQDNAGLKSLGLTTSMITIKDSKTKEKIDLYWIFKDNCWKKDEGKGDKYDIEVEVE